MAIGSMALWDDPRTDPTGLGGPGGSPRECPVLRRATKPGSVTCSEGRPVVRWGGIPPPKSMESCPPEVALVASRPVFDVDSSHDIPRPSSSRISGDIPPPRTFTPPRNTPLAGTFFLGETRTLHNVPASPLSYAGPAIPVAAVVVEKIFSDKFEGGG